MSEAPLPEPGSPPRDASVESAQRRQKVLEQKQYVTGRIGESCRFIGFGLIAIFYTLKTSKEPFAQEIVAAHPSLLWLIGSFGVLAIVADYLQYVMGSFAVESALANEAGGYKYDDKSCSYRARSAFYWAKQVFVGIGAAGLILIMVL